MQTFIAIRSPKTPIYQQAHVARLAIAAVELHQ
jgi:hypothetical protein